MTGFEHPISSERPSPSSSAPSTPSSRGDAPVADVPRTWDESRDPAFFTLTARLFPPATTLAMTVLLASHDVDLQDVDPASTLAGPRRGPRSSQPGARRP